MNNRRELNDSLAQKNIPLHVILLLFFSCTDIYLISGVKVTYVFTIPLILLVLKRFDRIRKVDLYLVLWYASYFLSYGHIVSFKDFVTVLIGQFVLFIIYIYFSNINDCKYAEMLFAFFEKVLYLMVYIGALQLILFYLVGSSWGISHVSHGVGLPRTSALCREPDWYGVICMMAMIIMLLNVLYNRIVFNRQFDICTLIASALSLLFSLTRAAWVGTVSVVLIILFIKMNNKQSILKRKLVRMMFFIIPIITFATLFLLLTENPIFLKLMTRLDPRLWTSNDGGAAGSRTASIEIMFHYIQMHPLTGNGVGGMGEISSNTSILSSLGYNYEINAGRGNANVIITNLFDVGIIGTLFFILYFFNTIKMAIKSFKLYSNYYVYVCLLLLIGLLVDFQFNNGIRQAYVWIILGLLHSFINQSEHQSIAKNVDSTALVYKY